MGNPPNPAFWLDSLKLRWYLIFYLVEIDNVEFSSLSKKTKHQEKERERERERERVRGGGEETTKSHLYCYILRFPKRSVRGSLQRISQVTPAYGLKDAYVYCAFSSYIAELYRHMFTNQQGMAMFCNVS